MRFAVTPDRARTLITSVPGEFDGFPPVPTLEIGVDLPATSSADRLAVGLSLVHAPWLAGPVEMPHPVSALTAQRITEFFGNRYVTLSTVGDRALPIPRGSKQVRIVDLVTHPAPTPDESAIALAPLTVAEGCVAYGRTLSIASNVHLFGTTSVSRGARLHTLGMGVLLAEFVDAGTLLDPSGHQADPRLHLLLESVGLGLAAA